MDNPAPDNANRPGSDNTNRADPNNRNPNTNTNQPPNPVQEPESEAAERKAAARKEQRLWERTKGNRVQTVKNFITKKMETAQISDEIKSVVENYAFTLLKLSNKLEAEQENPEEPLIPNSLKYNFTLESSKHVQGNPEFINHCLQVEEMIKKHNKEISRHCKATAKLEMRAALEQRAKATLNITLNLASVMTIQKVKDNPNKVYLTSIQDVATQP